MKVGVHGASLALVQHPVGLDIKFGQGSVWGTDVAQMGFIARICRRGFASIKNVMMCFCKLLIVIYKRNKIY